MVGLSVLLESHENGMFLNRGRRSWTKTGQIVVNQTAAMKPRPSSAASGFVVKPWEREFLHQCFLCKRKLLENEDIYMYMGEMAFCSEDCRLEVMMNMETNGGRVGQQREEEIGERSSQNNVKKESLFSADASPPKHEGKERYKSKPNGGIAC